MKTLQTSISSCLKITQNQSRKTEMNVHDKQRHGDIALLYTRSRSTDW